MEAKPETPPIYKTRTGEEYYLNTFIENWLNAMVPGLIKVKREPDPEPVLTDTEPVKQSPSQVVTTPAPTIPVVIGPQKKQTVVLWHFPDGRWLLRVQGVTPPLVVVDGQPMSLEEGSEKREGIDYKYFGFFSTGKSAVSITLQSGVDTYSKTITLDEAAERIIKLETGQVTADQLTAAVLPLTNEGFFRLTKDQES